MMADTTARLLRVHTVELLRQPGLRREISVAAPAASLGVHDSRLTADVNVDLVAESSVDGILVAGTVEVAWDDECRRCLRPLEQRVPVEVSELYQQEVSHEEAFEIGPDALDLVPLVRDAVVLVLADPPPLCIAACAGLCPLCGIDRNQQTCACDTEVRDHRWAALDELRTED
jgi:uncharacterized protein